MSDQPTFEAAVIGGGPVGLTTALLLAQVGLRTALIFPPPPPGSQDRRTAALFSGSIQLLRNLDVWTAVAPHAAPMLGIRIVDDQGKLLRAPETLFSANELGLSEFGFNVPNAALVAALTDAATANPQLTIMSETVTSITTTADKVLIHVAGGREIAAACAVGADGRQSLARSAAGITTKAWDYPQSAVVTSFSHQRPHHAISTEFHRPNGPLTTVPMPGKASSLVWVESPQESARLVALHEDAFRSELETRLNGLLGSIGDIGPRGMFPLSGLSAETMGQGRTALVGEAAHVMPPIGAQGLNLGLRDAAVLAECLGGAPHVPAAIERFARARSPDVSSRIAAIDALNRSLLTDFLPAHLARGLGLYALAAIPPLRRLVVREGLQPALATPLAMLAGGLKQLTAKSTPTLS